MREKEIDHLLLSPRFYHKALEVSMLMLPPALESLIQNRSTLPTAACVTTGERAALLIVYMALSLAMFIQVTKLAQVSVSWARRSQSYELRWEQTRHGTDISLRKIENVRKLLKTKGKTEVCPHGHIFRSCETHSLPCALVLCLHGLFTFMANVADGKGKFLHRSPVSLSVTVEWETKISPVFVSLTSLSEGWVETATAV